MIYHRFNLLYEECIEFNKLGLRDNVAQLCVLEVHNVLISSSALFNFVEINLECSIILLTL